jgi:curli biogenesis system outer membrane secretion channel CsgG
MIGSLAGTVSEQVASTAIYTAANSNVKPKEELTWTLNCRTARCDFDQAVQSESQIGGEDIISPIVEQAATALVETIGK